MGPGGPGAGSEGRSQLEERELFWPADERPAVGKGGVTIFSSLKGEQKAEELGRFPHIPARPGTPDQWSGSRMEVSVHSAEVRREGLLRVTSDLG